MELQNTARTFAAFLLLVFSREAISSPQFSACAFDARLAESPVKDGDKYRVKLIPLKRVKFKHPIYQDSESQCPCFGEEFVLKADISEESLDRIKDIKVGETARFVNQLVDGLYVKGDVFDCDLLELWDPLEYEVNN